MSTIVFCDSFVHDSNGPHLDEIIFEQPVRIHSFLVVPAKVKPHPSQVLAVALRCRSTGCADRFQTLWVSQRRDRSRWRWWLSRTSL